MWTSTTRQHHSRRAARYQSDLTDAEWRLIAPHLLEPKKTGRPWKWRMREVVNAIFYVLRSGCPWRQMPTDLVPWSTALPLVRRVAGRVPLRADQPRPGDG